MPKVPEGTNMTGYGKSPLAERPSQANLMMALATMHGQGALESKQHKSPKGQPMPGEKKRNRPLKVMR